MNEKWDLRFLDLARHVSSWSKDPSTKVGAVIVRWDRTIASVGYNGFPRHIDDTPERLNDRETKYRLMVHAEINAIHNARERLMGYTLYTWPFFTCERCAVQVIQAGIHRIVAPYTDNERWRQSIDNAIALYREAGLGTGEYRLGDVAELVDAGDLKPPSCGCEGSSPSVPTKIGEQDGNLFNHCHSGVRTTYD